MRLFLIFACLPLSLLCVAPASAQTMADLDRISDLSANEETGIDAARELAERGDYLEALATLERVMAVYPRSLGARLLHAVYLCRIDDRQGGLVEIDRMDEDDFGRDNLAQARDQCSRPYVEPTPPAAAAPPPPPSATASVPSADSAGNKVLPPEETGPVPANPAPGASVSGNSISGANRVGEEAGTTSGSSSSSSSSSATSPSDQLPPGNNGGEKD